MRNDRAVQMPIELGVLTAAADAVHLHATARRAEDLGFTRLAVTDHLDLSGAHVARLSWVPALASAAAVTSTLRLTPMVANQDLRPAAVLACEVSSLDRLSNGRMELGIGAGWNADEYAWAGLPFDPAGARIDRLAEVITAVRGLLSASDEPFTLMGDQVTINAMPRVPSVQQPLPIRIGAAQPRMLALAAGAADIVNVNTLWDTRPTDVVLGEKIGILGNFPGRIELSVVLVAIGDDPMQAIEASLPTNPFAQRVVRTTSGGVEALARMPHVLAGSVNAIAEEMQRRRERWSITSTIIPESSLAAGGAILEALR